MDISKNIATIISEFGFYKCNSNSCKMNCDFIRMSKNKRMPFQRLEELDEIERWRKMARIDAIFFYAYPTVLVLCSYFVCPANNDILLAILFYTYTVIVFIPLLCLSTKCYRCSFAGLCSFQPNLLAVLGADAKRPRVPWSRGRFWC